LPLARRRLSRGNDSWTVTLPCVNDHEDPPEPIRAEHHAGVSKMDAMFLEIRQSLQGVPWTYIPSSRLF